MMASSAIRSCQSPFRRARVSLAALRVDERILIRPLKSPLKLRFHSEEIRMRSQQYIAGKLFDARDAGIERVVDSHKTEAGRGHGIQTIRVHDIEAPLSFAGAPGPARAAWRVAGREARGDRKFTDAQRFAVADHAHVPDRRISVVLGSERELWIILGGAASLERRGTGRACGNRRPARPLKRRQPAGMIVVRVRIHDQANVLHAESELANVLGNERGRLRQSAVEKDQPSLRRDQDRGQPRGSHVVRVAEYPERLMRDVPCLAGRTELGRIRLNRSCGTSLTAQQANQTCDCADAFHRPG